ncbi:GDYXXLXY domain-containing protein [Comamonas sp. NLF-1-9]|uniref:GDYXXLXY domain-containing protein n=1 Tax=Comamonas sp. NLF-1-9 TaxID=2853163 RepID=UPI001C4400BC|nr:GDYXXLXY domain-containing protein [Comamonas sp. NLF-1-9]QXL84347.1 GDYXXLXY domain-containing protein [Comamonas sp. NLF-1-9]
MKAQTRLLQQGVARGLLPAQALQSAQQEAQPSWLVMVLGYLGASLVAALGLGVLALLSWGAIFRLPGSLLSCAAFTAAALYLLRKRVGLFAAQMAFSLLIVGQVMWLLSWGLHWWTQGRAMLVGPLIGLLALQLGAAWLARVVWVQRLLGMAAAWTFVFIPLGLHGDGELVDGVLSGALADGVSLNLWLLTAAWAWWCLGQTRMRPRAWSLRLSALADGAAVALLLTAPLLMALQGVGNELVGLDAQSPLETLPALFDFNGRIALRILLVAASAAWLLGRRQADAQAAAEMRAARPLLALVYALLLLACWVLPVETAAVVGTVALGTGRPRLLWLALAVLLVQLAQFYYLLQWSLSDKALLLAGAGTLLALAVAALSRRPGQRPLAPPPRSAASTGRRGRAAALAALAAALVALALVHQDASRKQQLIAQGQKVFVALAPVDPRSLLQGDYMALNFTLPAQLRTQLEQADARGWAARRQAVARLGPQGVAELQRLARPHEPLAADELLLPLRYLKGRWTLVTDAYFFPEGQAERFSRARYGEFRVLPGGKALLAGLADASLQPITALPPPARSSK